MQKFVVKKYSYQFSPFNISYYCYRSAGIFDRTGPLAVGPPDTF